MVWDYRWDAGWLEDQEAFGGKSRAPQATPLVHEDRVVVLGFTGWLHCLDRKTGRAIWKRNLVETFEAEPVQFGFSASPIIHEGQLMVLAGGQAGGLVAMDLQTGESLWNVPCEEASYATPLVFEVNGSSQIVFVTRTDIVGVDPTTGAERWRYGLPKPGMTNVPTPLPLGPGRLAVSGQGIGGTLELVVSRRGEDWQVTEGWRTRSEFFYCNWLRMGERILGCNGDLLLALDGNTGERLARWRGFRDANLIGLGDRYVIVDGEGVLSLAEESPAGLQLLARYEVLDERCWAPASISAGQLYCRGGDTVVCLTFDDAAVGERLPSLEIQDAELAIKSPGASRPDTIDDPVDHIVTRFEAAGPQAAWETYQAIRASDGASLTLAHREELAGLALEQGLIDFGKQILQHAVEDFSSDAARQLRQQLLSKYDRQPSSQTTQGENGLVYVELGVRNPGNEMIQTVVKGPGKHPFSYGIPFPSGKLRIEKWPVGTRLFAAENEVPGKVLLVVEEASAGEIIDLPHR